MGGRLGKCSLRHRLASTNINQILSMGYGLSFWPIPVMAAIESGVATELGNAARASWFIPAWTLSITVCFMVWYDTFFPGNLPC